MRLCAFLNTDTAPERELWIGFFYDGAARLPVVFTGATEKEMADKAEAFRIEEGEKAARALGRTKKAAA